MSENNIPGQDNIATGDSTFDQILHRYLSYLPLYIISLLLFLSIGFIFSRYSPITYSTTTTMLVHEPDSKNAGGDLLDELLGNSRVNLDNEIQVIKSTPLAMRVVERLKINIHYRIAGKIRKTESKESQVPFKLYFADIRDSSKPINFGLRIIGKNRYQINYKEKNFDLKAADTLRQKEFTLSILPNYSQQAENLNDFTILWNPISSEASRIVNALKVNKVDKMSTILKLSITGPNSDLNESILNGIIYDYKQQNLEDKNEIAVNTINFINDRLNIVTRELSGVEENLKDYKTANKIINPDAQLDAFVSGANDLQKEQSEVNVKIQVASMVQNYISNKSNTNKLVPSNLGIEDPVLLELVQTYNSLQLKKDASLKSGIPSLSPIIENYDNQLNLTKASIIENLKNIKQALSAKRSDVMRDISKINTRISSLPENEQRIKEIGRQRGIKETLYLYLLQKREETAISTAGNISNYSMVEPPYSNIDSPKKSRILLLCGLLGLLLPFTFVYLKGLFNTKILNRNEVSSLGLPIVGELTSLREGSDTILTPNTRTVIAEQFRIIRTNIQYLSQGKENQTILFTSTISGEGKSFTSANMALIYAFAGKRTALMEFDLRKPKAFSQLKLIPNSNKKGITDFLIGKAESQDLVQVHPEYANLSLFQAGAIPPNPSELLLSDRLEILMDYVKKNYDIVIIDSAPLGLVSDTFTLSKYADITLYLIRQRFSYKKQLPFIADLYHEKKLQNIGMVVNDVAYGSSYGYNYSYYGYGNGYFDLPSKSLWTKFKQLFVKA